MASSKKASSIYYKGFDGIDTRKSHSGKETSANIENFRINDDGTLELRNGYKVIANVGNKITLAWAGDIRGTKKCYYVTSDRNVFSFNLSTYASTQVGAFANNTTAYCFFFYQGSLYLKTSSRIYLVTDSTLSESTGYVPLVGKDWGTSLPGEIYQPINIMHKRFRISYKIPASHTAMLSTMYPVASVVALYRNGVELGSTSYVLDTNLNVIKVAEIETGDEFVAVLERKSSSSLISSFKLATKIKVFGDVSNSKLYIFGSNLKNNILCSTMVSSADLTESEAVCPGYGEIYITEDAMFSVGDGDYTIKSILRHHDRLIIFNQKQAWSVDPTGNAPAIKLNSPTGCYQLDGAVIADNIPYTVGPHGVLQWNINTTDPNKSHVEVISKEIHQLLPSGFLRSCYLFYFAHRNELWLYTQGFTTTVFIYNLSNKTWTSFTDLLMQDIFSFEEDMYLWYNYSIMVMKDDQYSDMGINGNGIPIKAKFTSGILSFDSTDYKRLSEGKLIGDLNNAMVNMVITTDTGEEIYLPVNSSSKHTVDVRRLNSQRFRHLTFVLNCTGGTKPTIHSVKLTARTKE